MERYQFLWEEYRYRHDLIWQRIFRFTAAVIVVSLVPYVEQDVARGLGWWLLLVPFIASVLAGFVVIVILNELVLFDKIKDQYRRHQNELLPNALHRDKRGRWPPRFKSLVRWYLIILLAMSIGNGFFVALKWIPHVEAKTTRSEEVDTTLFR